MASLFFDFLNNFENNIINFQRNFRLLNSQINRGKSVSKKYTNDSGKWDCYVKANHDYINLLYCTYVRAVYLIRKRNWTLK
jgi:hypothetical protein